MKNNIVMIAGGAAALGLALAALPSRSANALQQDDSSSAAQKVRERGAKLATVQDMQEGVRVQGVPGSDSDAVTVFLGGEGASWLGVGTQEVTSENAKELKLPAERGVVVDRITPDSPAAKAGLKEKDVITELDGQRVEGAAQFRRMIHEIPAGRPVQLTVWRDGRAQTITATLGKAEQGRRTFMNAAPGAFAFRMPEMPEIPPMEFDGGMMMFPGAHPRLGIDAEDIGGQLGAYFGAPDSEGVLVRGVNAGSPAEKAGVKAGDVITSFDGERIRSLGDLRQRLAAKTDDKPSKLGILRNKSEMTLDVELPAPAQKKIRTSIRHSTNI